jgi:dihydrodipicolinate synthase/N-acetylneuraminate lyase
MKPFTADKIRGNWATILLPINEDDTIDFVRLADEVDYLMQVGVDGVYTNGTAGEFYAQTEAEFDQIQEIVATRCEQNGVPFQIGASHMDALIMLSRIERAAALAPAAIQVILPDWFPLAQAEQITFLREAALRAAPVGLVLYNPPHAKRVLSPAEIGALAKAVPELVGLKVAGGNDAWYAAMREHCSGLSIFVPGHHLASGISQGAHGAYSNVACLSPWGSQRWTEQLQTDLTGALATQARIQHFFAEYVTPYIVDKGYANQAADKLLAAVGDWSDVGTRLRPPHRWIPQAEAEAMRPIARAALPELFAPDCG